MNADKYLLRLRREISKLAHTGSSHAKIREQLNIDFVARQVVCWPVRIIYRVEGGTVFVMHLHHGARQKLTEHHFR